jgi:protein-disulfide isomerase
MSSPDDLPAIVSGTDHVLGVPEAPVTLIEYGDFECPNCRQAAPAVRILMKRFEGRLRFVYRHFPLEEVHACALTAAEASEAAAAQGRFWEMHDELYASQSGFDGAQFGQLAHALRLDVQRFLEELGAHVHMPRIRESLAAGRRLGIRATPTFYVNGTLCDVSFGLGSLQRAVEKVLARRGRPENTPARTPAQTCAHR